MIDISETIAEESVRSYYVKVSGRNVKVIECPMPALIKAAYQWHADTIFIDGGLRNYPMAYDDALKHEMEHAKYRNSTFMHTWIDIRDGFSIRDGSKELIEYIKSTTPKDFSKAKANILTWVLTITIIFIAFWVLEQIWGLIF